MSNSAITRVRYLLGEQGKGPVKCRRCSKQISVEDKLAGKLMWELYWRVPDSPLEETFARPVLATLNNTPGLVEERLAEMLLDSTGFRLYGKGAAIDSGAFKITERSYREAAGPNSFGQLMFEIRAEITILGHKFEFVNVARDTGGLANSKKLMQGDMRRAAPQNVWALLENGVPREFPEDKTEPVKKGPSKGKITGLRKPSIETLTATDL